MPTLPYFSLDVVNFHDIAEAAKAPHVGARASVIFDDFTWGDASYTLITAAQAIEAMKVERSLDENEQDDDLDAVNAIIEVLETLPPNTMVNLEGNTLEEHEKAKSPLSVGLVDGKLVVSMLSEVKPDAELL